MDIDGSEPWALKGMEETIRNSPNLIMVCEYYPKYIEMAGGSVKEYDEFLDRYFTREVISGDYGDGYWNLLCRRK